MDVDLPDPRPANAGFPHRGPDLSFSALAGLYEATAVGVYRHSGEAGLGDAAKDH